jgi:hypothetical protein
MVNADADQQQPPCDEHVYAIHEEQQPDDKRRPEADVRLCHQFRG